MNLTPKKVYQLTSCSAKVIPVLLQKMSFHLPKVRPGRKFKHPLEIRLICALIKLKTAATYEEMEALLEIDAVTIYRYVNSTCQILSNLKFEQHQNAQHLIVDSTCTRVRSTKAENYSGYKHHTNRKVQIIIDDLGTILHTSKCYDGSYHDKRIWNLEYPKIKSKLDKVVLGDKGYAGGSGENTVLFRPVKRNENEYKNNKVKTKAYNRSLSKIRVRVEHAFARIKIFRILANLFPLKASRYGAIFKTVAIICNLKLILK